MHLPGAYQFSMLPPLRGSMDEATPQPWLTLAEV
jgi:hypothetical protein